MSRVKVPGRVLGQEFRLNFKFFEQGKIENGRVFKKYRGRDFRRYGVPGTRLSTMKRGASTKAGNGRVLKRGVALKSTCLSTVKRGVST